MFVPNWIISYKKREKIPDYFLMVKAICVSLYVVIVLVGFCSKNNYYMLELCYSHWLWLSRDYTKHNIFLCTERWRDVLFLPEMSWYVLQQPDQVRHTSVQGHHLSIYTENNITAFFVFVFVVQQNQSFSCRNFLPAPPHLLSTLFMDRM